MILRDCALPSISSDEGEKKVPAAYQNIPSHTSSTALPSKQEKGCQSLYDTNTTTYVPIFLSFPMPTIPTQRQIYHSMTERRALRQNLV